MEEQQNYLNQLHKQRDDELQVWVKMICICQFDVANRYMQSVLATEKEIVKVKRDTGL